MRRRSVRLAAWLVALLLSLPLFIKAKGRVSHNGGGAAFLRSSSAAVVVRLAGDFPRCGVYRLQKGTTVTAVTNMTLSGGPCTAISGVAGGTVLATGDILTLSSKAGRTAVLSLTTMRTSEKILLEIPLDPDRMGLSDWCSLPGIGPVLAARIVADRQENGAFGSVEGVLRVPGIGPGKLAHIRRYF